MEVKLHCSKYLVNKSSVISWKAHTQPNELVVLRAKVCEQYVSILILFLFLMHLAWCYKRDELFASRENRSEISG